MNDTLATRVMGSRSDIVRNFPWVVIVNKTEQYRFQFRDDAEAFVKNWEDAPEDSTYALIERGWLLGIR
jgi:hypothetical protein